MAESHFTNQDHSNKLKSTFIFLEYLSLQRYVAVLLLGIRELLVAQNFQFLDQQL
jgi:hypothetical protein